MSSVIVGIHCLGGGFERDLSGWRIGQVWPRTGSMHAPSMTAFERSCTCVSLGHSLPPPLGSSVSEVLGFVYLQSKRAQKRILAKEPPAGWAAPRTKALLRRPNTRLEGREPGRFDVRRSWRPIAPTDARVPGREARFCIPRRDDHRVNSRSIAPRSSNSGGAGGPEVMTPMPHLIRHDQFAVELLPQPRQDIACDLFNLRVSTCQPVSPVGRPRRDHRRARRVRVRTQHRVAVTDALHRLGVTRPEHA
jgi:hypothetical protein